MQTKNTSKKRKLDEPTAEENANNDIYPDPLDPTSYKKVHGVDRLTFPIRYLQKKRFEMVLNEEFYLYRTNKKD